MTGVQTCALPIYALDEWYKAYCNQASWVNDDTVKSMNLPAMIASEIARQVTLEMQWNITGKTPEKAPDDEETPEAVDNPRAEYLRKEFEKLMAELRKKLEQGCAAGGMAVRPYPNTEDGIKWNIVSIIKRRENNYELHERQ